MKTFLEDLNTVHETIKFISECSSKDIHFLDVNVKVLNGHISTDLFVKETDTHQYLEFFSCHPYHCKKGIPYSPGLRINRICSDVDNFDKRCNELESWLHERGYNEKMVRAEILRARAIPRYDLLNKSLRLKKHWVFTLNISYYPVFQKVKDILKEIHILLTPNEIDQFFQTSL